MVHIQYFLAPSNIHWIWCFTYQDIEIGFCIAEASPLLDINLTEQQFQDLSDSEKREIQHHGHFDTHTQKWHVDFDMTRFANHSNIPNIQQLYNDRGYYIVAIRRIQKWEELLIDYGDFEESARTRIWTLQACNSSYV